MYYVTSNNMEVGMQLGKSLYDSNGQVILRAGIVLTENYVRSIRRLNYNGIYVSDKQTEDIKVEDVVNAEVRHAASKYTKSLFSKIQEDAVKKTATSYSSQVQNSLVDLKEVMSNLINDILNSKDVIVNLIDLKTYDDYTFQHSTNVAVISLVIGVAMNLNSKKLHELGMAAILHDIGKMLIDVNTLNKTTRLTAEELVEIKSHAIRGYEYVKKNFIELPAPVYIGILQHHEKYNGQGYPSGKEKDDIHIYGRIIAIADVFDAITSKRPYHEPILPSEAYEYIMSNANEHFDKELVHIFTKKVAAYPIGLTVKLSNGLWGVVAENYSDCMMRPKIKLIGDTKNYHKEYIDLKNDLDVFNITITEIL